ncbi:ABC transporter ATP-binding protein [uncultured Thermanaerothrix sp.]|uniref:ABC transporter ATP-binding protein n=1 Tax=uncultured Thermanaerothrix sp. TaxID=1195149 RepID=UPI002633F2EC|nr:ABC transporter ATP-binding protein [uncultured Thermanaerothrix sp.]
MSRYAIQVRDLGKQYRIGTIVTRYPTLREAMVDRVQSLFRRNHHPTETIWALRHVSFEVEHGKVLGVIGRNGAGKSTLLKILSRVTEPTEGEAEIHGRVGSLLEVGTGFHPELTGRENIYLNGAILGMKRTEIDRKFDEIVAFAEVEPFIDTPVKRYSSGMYLRLAFAVAAHLEPEILVVDEVLAVGDAEFQRKCLGKMGEVAREGRTVLFVSHNMSAILRLTEETLVLDKGRLVMRAPTPEAVDFYLSQGFSQTGERIWHPDEVPAAAAPFRPIALRIRNAQGQVVDTIRSVEPSTIEIEYELSAPIPGLRVGLYLMSTRGEYVFTSFDTDDPEHFEQFAVRPAGRYISRCLLPANLLNEGRFVVGVNASAYRVRRYFQDEQALTFTVDATGAPGTQWPEPRLGAVRPRLEWQVEVA